MALKESKKLEQANSYELVVTVDGETFEKALNTVYKKEVKKINIPGFRKGKAPRHIIEKMYGKEVFYDDAMQDCYPEALYNAAEEAGVKIVKKDIYRIKFVIVEELFNFTFGSPPIIVIALEKNFLAGQIINIFKIGICLFKLHEIKAKELPEVDDEFVKDVSEKETVAEYRDELKETIAARLEDEAEKEISPAIITVSSSVTSVFQFFVSLST
jgi:FKBP-type peptidyl-prolyl cis-trans isomerase (trigger factor)